MPPIHKLHVFVVFGVFFFALFFLTTLHAVEIEYAKVFDVTGNAKFVGLKSGSWKPLSKNLVLKSGARIKTGGRSCVQIKMNRDYSSVIQVNPHSYLKIKNEPPNKITIEKGDLYVIREADSETKTPAGQETLQISTKDLLVEIKQGGCIVSVTDRGTWLKVFQEKVEATHVLADRSKTKTWTVYEGTALHAKSHESQTSLTRMQYEDYSAWQVWIRSWYDRKDKISAEKLRKDLAI